jgi:AcrR family transcriptional regulator
MNEMPAKLRARAVRKTAKRDEKKRQIAESAIGALKELGYANTSLRDIAERSDLSLGMLHYYFEDKTELIIHCVRIYKDQFVETLIAALEQAEGRDQVIDALAEGLATTVFEDEMTHRLWYDIRCQAMFDESFRPVVAEIEEMLIGIVRLAYVKAGLAEPQDIALSYALLDGAYRYLMQGQIGTPVHTRDSLVAVFRGLLNQLL